MKESNGVTTCDCLAHLAYSRPAAALSAADTPAPTQVHAHQGRPQHDWRPIRAQHMSLAHRTVVPYATLRNPWFWLGHCLSNQTGGRGAQHTLTKIRVRLQCTARTPGRTSPPQGHWTKGATGNTGAIPPHIPHHRTAACGRHPPCCRTQRRPHHRITAA